MIRMAEQTLPIVTNDWIDWMIDRMSNATHKNKSKRNSYELNYISFVEKIIR